MKTFSKVFDTVYKAIRIVCFFILAVMLVSMFWQVITRYIFRHAAHWTLELTLFLFLWVSFLGAALGVRKMTHVNVAFVINKLTGHKKTAMSLVALLIVEVFAVFLLVSGYQLAASSVTRKSETLMISMAWAYSSLPVGAFFVLLFNTENLIRLFVEHVFRKPADTEKEGS